MLTLPPQELSKEVLTQLQHKLSNEMQKWRKLLENMTTELSLERYSVLCVLRKSCLDRPSFTVLG